MVLLLSKERISRSFFYSLYLSSSGSRRRAQTQPSVVALATGSVCPFRDAAMMSHGIEGTTRWPKATRASRHGPTDTGADGAVG